MASSDGFLSVRVAEVAAISASAFLSGILTSISIMTVPVLLQTPTPTPLLLQHWKAIFIKGRALGPAVAAVAGLSYGFVAYRNYRRDADWVGYAGAGAATLAIVPYTLLFMGGVNARLMDAAVGRAELRGGEAMRLVGVWGRLNAGRGVFPLVGAVVGLWCAL